MQQVHADQISADEQDEMVGHEQLQHELLVLPLQQVTLPLLPTVWQAAQVDKVIEDDSPDEQDELLRQSQLGGHTTIHS